MNQVPQEMVEAMKLMQSLVNDINEDAAELEEHIFKRDFLPLLTADKEVDLRAWISIAGHASRRVNIYKLENGTKKILYTVPGIVNLKGFTKTDYHHATSMLERVQTAMRRVGNTPAMAKAIYDEELASAAINGVEFSIRDLLDWNNVLVANGLKPILESTLPQDTVNDFKKIQTDGWDDF